MTRSARALALAFGVLALLAVAFPADAAPASGPSVTLDRSTTTIGDRVLVTLHGWPSQRAVAISLCGNAAARGSVDCDLTNSLGYGINAAQPVQAVLFRITPPPVPCPCVIQVTNTTQTETATAPITIAGFPTAPVVGNQFDPPLTVSVDVKKANPGLWAAIKSSLAGPTTYSLTVNVHNKSAQDVADVRLIARAGRGAADQARLITIKGPDVVGPGETWTGTEKVTLAAPVVGRFSWSVAASGAGPTVSAQSVTRHVPLLLMLVVLVIVGDVAVIVGRRIRRRGAAREERATSDAEPDIGHLALAISRPDVRLTAIVHLAAIQV